MTKLSITQINLPPDFIDLGMGNPDISLLPIDLLSQAADKYFSAGDARSLQYGAEQGNVYFRLAMANFLTKTYGAHVNPDRLFVTAGASSALDLLCTLFTRSGDMIFVEEPSYFLALRIFEDHGLRTIPIPMDDDGLRIDALEEKLAEFRPKFIYTIPTFQNPSGRTLSQERREKLIEIAQQHNFLIVADEVYHFLNYTQTPPQPFAAFVDDVEQVISVNSFSKILAPGLRLGWIEANKAVIKRLAGSGMLDSGGGMNPFTSALVRGLVESGGLEKNIANLRVEYVRRLAALDTALQNHLPAAEYTLPQGGFFFWVRLPGVDAAELRSRAQGYKVDLRQGTLFSSEMKMQDYMRLSYCFYGPEALEEGIKRLKVAWEKE
ncbi:MAG: PLP-dependent aminotransferase family protein [Anaerolineaceae bacterium]|nr:PLP-dependent aminotransferase family protein [Anaerolineaceae bacterium]